MACGVLPDTTGRAILRADGPVRRRRQNKVNPASNTRTATTPTNKGQLRLVSVLFSEGTGGVCATGAIVSDSSTIVGTAPRGSTASAGSGSLGVGRTVGTGAGNLRSRGTGTSLRGAEVGCGGSVARRAGAGVSAGAGVAVTRGVGRAVRISRGATGTAPLSVSTGPCTRAVGVGVGAGSSVKSCTDWAIAGSGSRSMGTARRKRKRESIVLITARVQTVAPGRAE